MSIINYLNKMTEVERIHVQTLNDGASVPRRSTEGAAGYDLTSTISVTMQVRSSVVIPTGIAMAIPAGLYGRIASRSGLSVRSNIEVGAGVIDSDYRGEICVKLYNHSDVLFDIVPGMRIAQIIFERIATPEICVDNVLDETRRGDGGFGSTGL